jgi:surfeit locus 1 family protein
MIQFSPWDHAILPMLSRFSRLRFRPRWWGVLLMLAACASTLSLGHWQAGRAEEKRGLAERFARAGLAVPVPVPGAPVAAGALVFKRLSATGEFLPEFTVLLDNKVYRGRPGYFVVTPMRIAGSAMHVLVNRGWVAAGARREDVPEVKTPAGRLTIEGFGQEHAPRVLAVGSDAPKGRVWQGLSLDGFARWSGLALQPVFLEQHAEVADGLVRDWPAPDFGIDRHTSYAMQWYLIAVLSVVIFVCLSFDRDRPAAS